MVESDERMEVEKLRAKVRADALYLKLLLDTQAFKADHEARVRCRLADTLAVYPELFVEDIDSGKQTREGLSRGGAGE